MEVTNMQAQITIVAFVGLFAIVAVIEAQYTLAGMAVTGLLGALSLPSFGTKSSESSSTSAQTDDTSTASVSDDSQESAAITDVTPETDSNQAASSNLAAEDIEAIVSALAPKVIDALKSDPTTIAAVTPITQSGSTTNGAPTNGAVTQ